MTKPLINIVFIFLATIISNANLYANSFLISEKDESHISVVVIDPGHGGNDYGASVGNAKEKDIVLNLALKLGELIKTNYPEIKVIYTRTRDVFIPLYERADIANKNKADLFISIHVNATENTGVQGTETFVLGQHRSKDNLEVAKKENSVILLEDDYNTKYEGFDPNSPESYIMFELVQDEYLEQSVMLASDIQEQFKNSANRADRSVKQAGFLVLRRTTMPSVLIEAGFISHATERSFMLSEAGKTKLAGAIFTAFKAYKRKIEDKSSFAVRTETSLEKTNKNQSEIKKESKSIYTKPAVKNNIYYTVQISASKRKLKTSPSNFKGEKNVYRKDWDNISRYFSGRFSSLELANNEKLRLKKKYPDCFVVAFENDKLISVK